MAELQAGGPGRRLYQRRARPVPRLIKVASARAAAYAGLEIFPT